MECIRFEYEKKYVKDFIHLYHRLYHRNENMQNDDELKELLLGEHHLSKYFKLSKFCIYRKSKIVGRFAITVYPCDDTGYFGFFECENNAQTAAFLFRSADKFAKQEGLKQLTGPVDASFWIKYRLKLNLFKLRAYTGEPYNKDYYPKMFTDNGFMMQKHYTSSIYERVQKDFRNEKYEQRLREFTKMGYEIKSPTIDNFEETICDIYRMIMRLYRDFPIFKEISAEDFTKHFASYRQILNFEMVKMAYYEGKAVGFFISIPNYRNAVYHVNNPFHLIRILSLRKKPREYVMLYMGTEPEHRGLGKAMVQSIIETLSESGLPSIGALQMDGKVTQDYVSEKILQRYEYALYSKELS